MKTLYKYQQEVVDRAGKSTALFWDMGLGKTITSLEIYKKHNLDLLFVLCPVSMVDEWVREYASQVGKGQAMTYKEVVKKSKGNVEEYIKEHNVQCMVLNYDMVWRIHDYSWLTSKSMIICDESHRIKNHTSKVGKYMKFLKIKTPYKICLTGTPQSQGYIDYYNQMYFLDKWDMTLGDFKSRYCVYENAVFNGIKINQLTGYKNVGELESDLNNQCEFLKMERVYDDIVKYNYIQLPTNRQYNQVLKDRVIYYDQDNQIVIDRKEINKMLDGDISSVVTSYKYLNNPGAYRMGLRQLLNSKEKLSWLRDFLLDYDGRVVIFYNFNNELQSLKELMGSLGRAFSCYNGGEKDFTNFINSEDGVALCNYKSGSFGINDLVISNIFIAYSPTDNYLEWEQSKKRINRNGQLNTPIYYFLESGMESRIYKSLAVGKNFDDRVFISEMESDLI